MNMIDDTVASLASPRFLEISAIVPLVCQRYENDIIAMDALHLLVFRCSGPWNVSMFQDITRDAWHAVHSGIRFAFETQM